MKNMREKQKYIQKVEITAIKNGKQYYEKSKEKKMKEYRRNRSWNLFKEEKNKKWKYRCDQFLNVIEK